MIRPLGSLWMTLLSNPNKVIACCDHLIRRRLKERSSVCACSPRWREPTDAFSYTTSVPTRVSPRFSLTLAIRYRYAAPVQWYDPHNNAQRWAGSKWGPLNVGAGFVSTHRQPTSSGSEPKAYRAHTHFTEHNESCFELVFIAPHGPAMS